MMLEYRVPVYRDAPGISDAAQAIRKTAPPNGYCWKEGCLGGLNMLDLRVVSV